jgi:hypothetical protein
MVPQNKSNLESDRTESTPAQEKNSFADETTQQLSAEQVYAERFAETTLAGSDQLQGFIP